MRTKLIIGLGALVVALLAGGAYFAGDTETPQASPVAGSLSGALTDELAGFARATARREFVFPDDHGPHPEYRSEWWYFTGNLEAADGRAFGFQLTFFRFALSPEAPARASGWAANQVYMGHFALADVEEGRFHAFERFSRAAQGLAGAQAEPFRAWLEDWEAAGSGDGLLPMRLRAAEEDIAIDLSLSEGKPIVLQGDAGLSQKSAAPGNASYYYSLTRLPGTGRIRVGDEEFEVQGLVWMDREWSTSALGDDQVGWDWFSLQLSDGRELMYYQLRRRDGRPDPHSAGTLVDGRGGTRRIDSSQVDLTVNDHWKSGRDGSVYPGRWRLRLADAELDLEIVPRLADQEMNLSVRYWEGAVAVTGVSGGRPVSGSGYVELTGYNEAR